MKRLLPIYPNGAYGSQWKGWRAFLGTTTVRIWTNERIIADARKYKTIFEWRKRSKSACSLAKLRGCWEEATAHMPPPVQWTKDRIIAEARQFKTRREWAKLSSKSYSAAVRHKLLAEATEHMLDVLSAKARKRARAEMSIGKVLESAKHFKTRTEWQAKDRFTYSIALEKGWLDETKPTAHRRWSVADIIADAKKYNTRNEWCENSKSAYSLAKLRKCFAEATEHMLPARRKVGVWTKELVIADARCFDTVPKWRTARTAAYNAARRHGWFAEATAHMPPQRKGWTVALVLEDVKKYETLNEWWMKSRGAYNAARRFGIFGEATKHFKRQRNLPWSKEAVQKDALKYSDSVTWRKQSRFAYMAAFKHGWFRQVTAHMTNIRPVEWMNKIKARRLQTA